MKKGDEALASGISGFRVVLGLCKAHSLGILNLEPRGLRVSGVAVYSSGRAVLNKTSVGLHVPKFRVRFSRLSYITALAHLLVPKSTSVGR